MLKDVPSISRQELEVACEDFSNIIGSSPDSIVYKGTMKGGPEIAVISICIKEENWTDYLELYFQREVWSSTTVAVVLSSLKYSFWKIFEPSCVWLNPGELLNQLNGCLCSIPLQVADLARLNHENVGKLLGYCKESSPFTRMLVFEYASNGTLYEHLHCKSSPFFLLP